MEPRGENQWRRLGLVAILILTAGLRVWPLLQGQRVWHPDEYYFVFWPLDFFGGDLNPHFFAYPSLQLYLLGVAYGIAMLVQSLGSGLPLNQWVALHYFWKADDLLYLAHFVSVAFALGTGWWAARLADRVFGGWAGLVAALLVGVCTTHVRQSLLVGVDVPMAFWYLGATWAAVRLIEKEEARHYALAGVLVGLAAATKYPGAVAGAPIALAHFLCRRSFWDQRLWLAGALAMGSFLLASPYVLLDFPAFRDRFLFLESYALQGHRHELGAGWWYHIKVSLRYGLGWPGLLGLAVALVQACRFPRKEVWVLWGGFLSLYLLLAPAHSVFVRYTMGLVVLQAVLVAGALQAVPRSSWRYLAVAAVVLVPLFDSVRLSQIASHADTRIQARAWVESHIPPGATCCNFGGWAGDVQLQTIDDHWRRTKFFERAFGREGLNQALAFLRQQPPARPFYSYAIHGSDPQQASGSLAAVRDNECSYVVVHRHPLSYSAVDQDFADSLAVLGEMVARFAPAGLADSAPSYDPIDAYYLPVGDFGDLEQPGPEIEIWRWKQYPVPAPQSQTTATLFAAGYARGAGEALGEKDGERALVLAERAVSLDPQGAKALSALAQVRLQRGENAAAAQLYERLLAQTAGGVEEHNNLGIAYWAAGEREKAITQWQHALKLRPDKADIHYNLGLASYLSGDRQAAHASWQQAASLNPPSAKAHYNLAMEYRQSGQDSLAIFHLEQALAAQPDLAGAVAELAQLRARRTNGGSP